MGTNFRNRYSKQLEAKHYTMMNTLDPLQETSCPNVVISYCHCGIFLNICNFLLAIQYFLTCTVVRLAILIIIIITILINPIMVHHPSTTSIIRHPSSLIITIIVTTLVERGLAENSYVLQKQTSAGSPRY